MIVGAACFAAFRQQHWPHVTDITVLLPSCYVVSFPARIPPDSYNFCLRLGFWAVHSYATGKNGNGVPAQVEDKNRICRPMRGLYHLQLASVPIR